LASVVHVIKSTPLRHHLRSLLKILSQYDTIRYNKRV